MVTSIPTLSGCPSFFFFFLVQGALNFRKFKRRLDRIPIYKIRLNVLYIRRFCNYSTKLFDEFLRMCDQVFYEQNDFIFILQRKESICKLIALLIGDNEI